MSKLADFEATAQGHDRINVTDSSADGLLVQQWVFWLYNGVLYLDGYASLSRPSRRHNMKAEHHWSRLFSNRSDMGFDDVPKPEQVAEAALACARERLRVTWKYER